MSARDIARRNLIPFLHLVMVAILVPTGMFVSAAYGVGAAVAFAGAAAVMLWLLVVLTRPPYKGRHVRDDGLTIFDQLDRHPNCRCWVVPAGELWALPDAAADMARARQWLEDSPDTRSREQRVDKFIETGDVRDLFDPHPGGLIGAARDERNMTLAATWPGSLGTMLTDVHAGGIVQDDTYGATWTAGQDLMAGVEVMIDSETGRLVPFVGAK